MTLEPIPGSTEERTRFEDLQRRLAPMFRTVFADRRAHRTVVVVPSLSLDPEGLARVTGVRYYEERQLSMLLLLRMPHTRIVFVTSQPLDPAIVDYYLNLLSGIPAQHARRRLTLLSTHDSSTRSLTDKILERPRLMARIRAAIGDPHTAHLSCFNATHREQTLAVQLGIPLYGCDPALVHLGSKSGSRTLFRAAGIPMAPGFENLRDQQDLIQATTRLCMEEPSLRRVVFKLNEGFSGEGNAVLDVHDRPTTAPELASWLGSILHERLRPEAHGELPQRHLEKFTEMGGIVEGWIEGAHKTSPSIQMRVNAVGALEVISTHDQVLGGPTGQVFLGSIFPADQDYRAGLHAYGRRVGEQLLQRGVLGRFALDFVAVRKDSGWDLTAIEINLRKGGTTLPFQMLQFLTDGAYDEISGTFLTPMGQPRSYYATDNLVRPSYRGLTPEDLIDLLVEHDLHFDETTQQGVVFNLIGALSEYGKLGLVCIAADRESAESLYRHTVAVIDRETSNSTG